MASKKKQLKRQCDELGITYSSNDTIADLENYIQWYKNLQPKYSPFEIANIKGLNRLSTHLSKRFAGEKKTMKEWEKILKNDGIL